MKHFILLMFAVLLMNFFGCGSGGYDELKDLSFEEGEYTFVMLDTSDNKLFEGFFNIEKREGNNISGTYGITKEYVEDFPGASTMRGEFDGKLSPDGKRAFVNTNPKIADANIFIRITAGKVSYVGRWEYVTMMGVKAWGYFNAYKD